MMLSTKESVYPLRKVAIPLWLRVKGTQLVSMRKHVQSLVSLSGLRIQHCHELWCRLQMQLRSHDAVAVE